MKKCVLLIACDPADTRLVGKALTGVCEDGLDIEGVTSLSSGVERIKKGGVLAVIFNLEMPDHHGIGTQKQGCTEGQGYFFCHPVIAEKFTQFLESG